jgi:hypothetical protein
MEQPFRAHPTHVVDTRTNIVIKSVFKHKVVFVTHSRSTHVTVALKAGDPLPAADMDR